MNSKTLKIIVAAVLVLVAVLALMEKRDQGGSTEDGKMLFPELKAQLNDIDTVTITRADTAEPVVLGNASGRWLVSNRDDYPADVVKIRNVLVAMADAKIVEVKTANPDLHDRLGLTSPDVEGSKGVLIRASNGDVNFSVIFGNVAQSSYRYARTPGEPQTWLIDQNPDLPKSAGDWLLNELLDIDQARIQQVTITHPDGETIRISKESSDDSGFVVNDIPAERELSYASVANGIAGALNDLTLEDVRRDQGSDDAVTAVFDTFDGLSVTVKSVKDGDKSWISLSASPGEENAEEASMINERTSGWQFRIADYKANLLVRRWDDILKAKPE